jgi:alcohol dehydrogenase class IV
MELVSRIKPDLIRRIIRVMGLSCLEEFKDLLNSLLGKKEDITDEEIYRFSDAAVKAKNMANCKVRPDRDEIEVIYRASFGKQIDLQLFNIQY